MHPFFSGLRPTLHIAHRGGAALAPENTMAAFGPAVERWRADMLELDVQATADGEIVVAHDATLDRCTDAEGPISAIPFSDLARIDAGFRFSPDGGRTFPFRGRGVRIPRLAEVLLAFPSVRINVELKVESAHRAAGLAEVIREAGATLRVCVGSEDDRVAQRLLEVLPDTVHFYPRQALTQVVLGLRGGETVPDAPYRVLDMPLVFFGTRLVDPVFLERARALGRWVNVWTIDDPVEMRRLAAEGVGGIMTDRPDLLRDVLDEGR